MFLAEKSGSLKFHFAMAHAFLGQVDGTGARQMACGVKALN
jgi:hypothetical protein